MTHISTSSFEKLSNAECYEMYCTILNEKEQCVTERNALALQNKELLDQVIILLKDSVTSLQEIRAGSKDNPIHSNQNSYLNVSARNVAQLPTPAVHNTIRPAKRLHYSTRNLVIGSSIVSNITVDDLPGDIAVHSYKGSTTESKISIIGQYTKRKMKSITLQDGTVSLHQNPSKPVGEIFQSFKELVNITKNTFSPEKLFICQVPPVHALTNNKLKNDRIQEFNNHMFELSGEDESIEIIAIYNELTGYSDISKLYRDELHPNDSMGVPILKNCITNKLLKLSSGEARIYNVYSANSK